VLLDLAAAIPPDRLPPLLLGAAVAFLVQQRRPALARFYPEPGGRQPPRDHGFPAELVYFARTERDGLAELCVLSRAHPGGSWLEWRWRTSPAVSAA
jgi:hypothetical protein